MEHQRNRGVRVQPHCSAVVSSCKIRDLVMWKRLRPSIISGITRLNPKQLKSNPVCEGAERERVCKDWRIVIGMANDHAN
jgi:hypothetical protein